MTLMQRRLYITRTLTLLSLLWLSLQAVDATAQQDNRQTVIVHIDGAKYYVHTVAAGETLYSISRLYNVDIESIVRHNPAAADTLRTDMTLKIPVPDASNRTETKKRKRDYEFYDVRAGETLYSISRKYGISIDALLEDNPDLNPSQLSVGQRLYIRKSAMNTLRTSEVQEEWENYRDTMNAIAPAGCFYYMIKPGDTLYSLSRRYGISEQEILSINKLPDGLKAGGLILLPLPEGQKADDGAIHDYDHEQVLHDVEVVDSVAYAVNERFRAVEPYRPLRVVLLLPLTKNGGAVNGHYLDFYRGFLTGAEEVKRAGYSMDVTLFDTEQSAARTAEIVEGGFDGVDPDLIVGPVYENELAEVVAYAERHKVPVVSPLASLASIRSRVVFQMSPDSKHKYDKTAELFDGSRDVALVYGTKTDKDFEREVLAMLNGHRYTTHKYVYDRYSGGSADFGAMMRGDKNSVIVVMSDNETEVDRILAAIASADIAMRTRERNIGKFSVFGNAKWLRFSNLDRSVLFNNKVVMLSSYSARPNDDKVREFDDRYIADYGALPSLYTYRGYDAAVIFGEGMFGDIERSMTGKRYCPLQTCYTFEPAADDANIVNNEWMRIDYNTDFTINVR